MERTGADPDLLLSRLTGWAGQGNRFEELEAQGEAIKERMLSCLDLPRDRLSRQLQKQWEPGLDQMIGIFKSSRAMIDATFDALTTMGLGLKNIDEVTVEQAKRLANGGGGGLPGGSPHRS